MLATSNEEPGVIVQRNAKAMGKFAEWPASNFNKTSQLVCKSAAMVRLASARVGHFRQIGNGETGSPPDGRRGSEQCEQRAALI